METALWGTGNDKTRHMDGQIMSKASGDWLMDEIMASLVRHWHRHPFATDTVEDIARHWLGRTEWFPVEIALSAMTDMGVVAPYAKDGHTFYMVRDHDALKGLFKRLDD